MAYQGLLRTAQKLLDEVLVDLATGHTTEVADKLKATPRADLLRARRLIDQQLEPNVPVLPVEVIDGGIPLGEWLADELNLDHERANRMLIFIEDYGQVADACGYEPTIPELAEFTAQSIATINRRLADFRGVFPGERNPARLSRALRDALNDQRLWSTVDESLEASIRDVPVIASSAARDQDRVVHALAQAANALKGTAVGSISLYKFMVDQGMEVPRDAGVLETTLRQAWRVGRIMRAPNGVYTPLDGSGKTEWDRPLTDYYVAAEQGFPLPA